MFEIDFVEVPPARWDQQELATHEEAGTDCNCYERPSTLVDGIFLQSMLIILLREL